MRDTTILPFAHWAIEGCSGVDGNVHGLPPMLADCHLVSRGPAKQCELVQAGKTCYRILIRDGRSCLSASGPKRTLIADTSRCEYLADIAPGRPVNPFGIRRLWDPSAGSCYCASAQANKNWSRCRRLKIERSCTEVYHGRDGRTRQTKFLIPIRRTRLS